MSVPLYTHYIHPSRLTNYKPPAPFSLLALHVEIILCIYVPPPPTTHHTPPALMLENWTKTNIFRALSVTHSSSLDSIVAASLYFLLYISQYFTKHTILRGRSWLQISILTPKHVRAYFVIVDAMLLWCGDIVKLFWRCCVVFVVRELCHTTQAYSTTDQMYR